MERISYLMDDGTFLCGDDITLRHAVIEERDIISRIKFNHNKTTLNSQAFLNRAANLMPITIKTRDSGETVMVLRTDIMPTEMQLNVLDTLIKENELNLTVQKVGVRNTFEIKYAEYSPETLRKAFTEHYNSERVVKTGYER